jgi:formamidopyrimidine-DNA glycosylase
MPELPELEGFKSYIDAHCLHKKISNVAATDPSLIKKTSLAHFKKSLVGHSFSKTQRLGKYLVITLSNSDNKVVMHFGLTGSLTYSKDPDQKVRFSKVAFIFSDHSVLHWIAIRKFEKIWLVKDINEISGLKKLGIDALAITKKQLLELLEKNKTKNIKALLMDQTKIAGIGNEYSDEILFQAGIDPRHAAKDLSSSARAKLYAWMEKVLKTSIKVQRKNAKKLAKAPFFAVADRASFPATYLQAHRHVDMHCPKHKTHTLKKITVAGRTSYFCPKDQK